MQFARIATAVISFASCRFWLVILPVAGSLAGLWIYFSLESGWGAVPVATGWAATSLLINMDRVRASARRREAAWNAYIERQIARAETNYIPNYWEEDLQANSL